MDDFYFVQHLNLLVCVRCQKAVTEKQILPHLRTVPHRGLSSRAAKEAADALRTKYPGLAASQEEVAVRLRHNADPSLRAVIPFLPGPFPDGRCCVLCRIVYRNTNGIQKHCRTRHMWKNRAKRGRTKRGDDQAVRDNIFWEEGVLCQRLFESGRGSSYYAVTISSTNEERESGSASRRAAAPHSRSSAALGPALRSEYRAFHATLADRTTSQSLEEARWTQPNPTTYFKSDELASVFF